MDEYKESNHDENEWTAQRIGSNPALVVAVVVLLVICVAAFAYGHHQKSMVSQVTAQAASANAAVSQMQGQVDALNAKLNQMTAAQTSAPAATASAATPAPGSEPPTEIAAQTPEASSAPTVHHKHVRAKRHTVQRHTAVDKKYEQLQAQLADQQKQLKDTQDEVAKDRSDLEGSISSTRDDLNSTRDNLNGSIAKNHDQLVALEKRGERSYFEFDLSKAKAFERVGPVSLSLRKADIKHKHYNLAMMVDDNELQKKNVNIYEPIWIDSENGSESVQIVVNKISKDHIHGYISAPKYKPSELAVASSSSAGVTPVAAKSPANAPSNAPDPQPPPQQ
ncbi:MAG: hypothetical protein ACRD51_12750 [Candidatus Acidiferrum sp.]